MVDKDTREQAALSRLRGDYDPSPSGQELAALLNPEGTVSEKDKDEDNNKVKEKDDTTEAVKIPAELQEINRDAKEEEKPRSLEKELPGRRSRSASPKRQRRESRRRSISPRYRSRGRYSPRSEREYRRSSYHQSRDTDERYRRRR